MSEYWTTLWSLISQAWWVVLIFVGGWLATRPSVTYKDHRES